MDATVGAGCPRHRLETSACNTKLFSLTGKFFFLPILEKRGSGLLTSSLDFLLLIVKVKFSRHSQGGFVHLMDH